MSIEESMTRSSGPFRVAYFNEPMHQSFLDTLASHPALLATRLDRTWSAERILAELSQCHGYYIRPSQQDLPRRWQVARPLLEQLPLLLMVASYGAGYDTIDVDDCSKAGVAAANQAGGNAEGVAEHALAMILSVLKRIPESMHSLKAGQTLPREQLIGRELAGKTVGVVGLGHIGRKLAAFLHVFDCRVIAYDPYIDDAQFSLAGAKKVSYEDLLARSEVISVSCPLTKETRNMFDAAAFQAMRQGVVFVTTARGGIHDEEALLASIESGRVAGAGLDVWTSEPPTGAHPLLCHQRVISSHHMGGVTAESRERVGRMAAQAFVDLAQGRVPARLLNPEVARTVLARAQQHWQPRKIVHSGEEVPAQKTQNKQ